MTFRKKWGVCYSDLLRLPCFDIVRCHCVDVMHNLLLGTAKHMLDVWKENGLLTPQQLEVMQSKIDGVKVPAHIGRIPAKITVSSSLTADQWRNWTCIYSLYALNGILPSIHYNCWVWFCQACMLLFQPVVSESELREADESLFNFV